MRKDTSTPLGKAVTSSVRVLGDIGGRWLRQNSGACAGCWTRGDALVIVAVDDRAKRIAGELERAGLFRAQRDEIGIEKKA